MPKLLVYKWMQFVMWSVDINENRKHIHIVPKKNRRIEPAKFWLEPNIELVDAGSFNSKEINEIKAVIIENKDLLIKQINQFISGNKIETIKRSK